MRVFGLLRRGPFDRWSAVAVCGLLVGLTGAGLVGSGGWASPAVRLAAGDVDVIRGMQWHLNSLELSTAHQRATGVGIIVAVLDSGVDASHPDLAGQILPGLDAASKTDVDGRGTGLAGLIAGHGHPAAASLPGVTPSAGHASPSASGAAVDAAHAAGVLGVAPGAKILPVAFAPAAGESGDPDRLADAISISVNQGAKIICIGRGLSPSAKLQMAIDDAVDRGVLVIAADADRAGRPFTPWPASYLGVLTAIAADRNGRVPVAPVSGRTTGITVPGVDIVTTGVAGGYRIDGGASAAAVLAGAAAVVWSAYPKASVSEILQRLRTTASDRDVPGADSRYGVGALNLIGALSAVMPGLSPSAGATATPAPSATPAVLDPASTALVDSRSWRRWLVVLPLAAFLIVLTGWAWLSGRRAEPQGAPEPSGPIGPTG